MGSLEEEHLAQAVRHLSEAEARIRQQRDLVQHLRGRGLDTEQADDLLKRFEEVAASLRTHYAIVRREHDEKPLL